MLSVVIIVGLWVLASFAVVGPALGRRLRSVSEHGALARPATRSAAPVAGRVRADLLTTARR